MAAAAESSSAAAVGAAPMENPAWLMNRAHMACLECRRKKTKCDMRQPFCGLCTRTGCTCVFPSKRKTPEPRKQIDRESQKAHRKSLERLRSLLEAKIDTGLDLEEVLRLVAAHGRSESRNPDVNKGSEHSTSPNTGSSPDYSAEGVGSAHPNVDDDATGDHQSTTAESTFSLDIPKDVADNLIHLYFDKVQAWLPMLHRPRFYARYMHGPGGGLATLEGYSLEEVLIFYGIFSLAARYSSSSYFGSAQARNRGAPFAETARELYAKARALLEPSSLPYLQGCILLAFSFYSNGPCPRGWLLTGICVRMAYELELNSLDEEQSNLLDAEEWSRTEEMRRAWWLVWELDAFGSSVSKRPYAIDGRKMTVQLPVSDEAWFSNTPVQSAVLRTRPALVWKSLTDCPNQSERAYFLIANYIMALVYDMTSGSEGAHEKERQELANAIACFDLSLPQTFHLETNSVFFDAGSFAGLASFDARVIGKQQYAPTNASVIYSAQRERELSRVVYHWSPEYIAVSHPFIACMMLLPPPPPNKMLLEPESQVTRDMLTLVLSKYAAYWGLGAVLLRLQKVIDKVIKQDTNLLKEDVALIKRYAVFFPEATKNANSPLPQSALANDNTHLAVEEPVAPDAPFFSVDPQMPMFQSPQFSSDGIDTLEFSIPTADMAETARALQQRISTEVPNNWSSISSGFDAVEPLYFNV